MADKRDYYEILGVDKTADDNTIKKAYWKLAKKYHPDVNPGDAEAEAKFKDANEAYEVLSDPEKRSRYDRYGHAGIDPNSFGGFNASASVDLNDLFNSIFGNFGGFGADFGGFSPFGSSRKTAKGPMPGANLRYRMRLDFMEAAFGCEREISIRKEDVCDTCHGTGAADGSEAKTCPICHGSGQVTRQQQTLFGQMMTTQTCSHCGGSGEVIEKPCPDCHGTGRKEKNRRLLVKVPAGINEGEMLTLRGEGEPGFRGGPSGDLYIEISIRPDPVFTRDGNNTFCEVPITYAQAALGDEIEIPTIDGTMKYKLNEGTQSGDVYTIKGKGIPYVQSRGRGDHRFQVVLEVPRNLNSDQKAMLKKFDESCNDSHYQKRPNFFDRIRTNIRNTRHTRESK